MPVSCAPDPYLLSTLAVSVLTPLMYGMGRCGGVILVGVGCQMVGVFSGGLNIQEYYVTDRLVSSSIVRSVGSRAFSLCSRLLHRACHQHISFRNMGDIKEIFL